MTNRLRAQPITLTTSRCRLRAITAADTDALHDLWTSPGVRYYLWDNQIIPRARTVEAVAQNQRLFDEHGYGLWGMWLEGGSPLSGFAGLWPFRDPPEMELVYGVADHLAGQGYASEMARAVVAHCFERLAMPAVRASTDVANTASVRVLEKLGFDLERRATVGGLDTVFYTRSRASR
jgi:RimJ/RimL family protein N-acetyltransferase